MVAPPRCCVKGTVEECGYWMDHSVVALGLRFISNCQFAAQLFTRLMSGSVNCSLATQTSGGGVCLRRGPQHGSLPRILDGTLQELG